MYGSGGAEIRWAVNSQLANKIEVTASTHTAIKKRQRGVVYCSNDHFVFFSIPPMRRSIAALATAKSKPMAAAPVADIPQGVLQPMMANVMPI